MCWNLLERGVQQTEPEGALEPFLDGSGVRLTEPALRSLIAVGRQADGRGQVTLTAWQGPDRQLLVLGELRGIGRDVEDALARSARGDWAPALEAVRMLYGRAAIARRALEDILGSNAAADVPPLVRAVQAVGHVVSDREIDSLAPDELRARMHAVLRVLDRELQSFLEPPVASPVPADRVRHKRTDSLSAPAKP